MNNILYLNNSGSRMTFKEKEPRIFALYEGEKFLKLRTASYFEMFGNFSTICFKYRGKMISKFADDCTKHNEKYPIVRI